MALSEKQREYNRKYQKEWRIKNLEKARKRDREYRDRYRDRILSYSRKYNETNAERKRAAKREWYEKNKEKCARDRDKYRLSNLIWWQGYKSQLECSKCGESRPACLDFHHINGEAKENSVGRMVQVHSKAKILKEIEKCIVLCANCHRVEHFGHAKPLAHHIGSVVQEEITRV